MAKIFKPRRGSSNVMSTTKANTVLASGEIFFETPNGGVGTGEGAGIKMGDGTTAYSNLPYFMKPVDVSSAQVTVTADNSSTSTAAINNVSSGATTGALIGSLKQAISLTKSELTNTIDDLSQSVGNRLAANNVGFYFDYQNGEYGFNTSETRGADTFSPFSKARSLLDPLTYIATNDVDFWDYWGDCNEEGSCIRFKSPQRGCLILCMSGYNATLNYISANRYQVWFINADGTTTFASNYTGLSGAGTIQLNDLQYVIINAIGNESILWLTNISKTTSKPTPLNTPYTYLHTNFDNPVNPIGSFTSGQDIYSDAYCVKIFNIEGLSGNIHIKSMSGGDKRVLLHFFSGLNLRYTKSRTGVSSTGNYSFSGCKYLVYGQYTGSSTFAIEVD